MPGLVKREKYVPELARAAECSLSLPDPVLCPRPEGLEPPALHGCVWLVFTRAVRLELSLSLCVWFKPCPSNSRVLSTEFP